MWLASRLQTGVDIGPLTAPTYLEIDRQHVQKSMGDRPAARKRAATTRRTLAQEAILLGGYNESASRQRKSRQCQKIKETSLPIAFVNALPGSLPLRNIFSRGNLHGCIAAAVVEAVHLDSLLLRTHTLTQPIFEAFSQVANVRPHEHIGRLRSGYSSSTALMTGLRRANHSLCRIKL